MARLIEADALIAKITDFACNPCKEKGRDYGGVRCRACQYGDEIEDIESAEELDAVPVVRCKDCKFFQYETMLDDILIGAHCGLIDSANVHGYRNGEPSFDTTLLWRNENDFCSRGERKENE